MGIKQLSRWLVSPFFWRSDSSPEKRFYASTRQSRVCSNASLHIHMPPQASSPPPFTARRMNRLPSIWNLLSRRTGAQLLYRCAIIRIHAFARKGVSIIVSSPSIKARLRGPCKVVPTNPTWLPVLDHGSVLMAPCRETKPSLSAN